MNHSPEISFGPCCFCGKPIESSDIDPCSVTITTKKDHWQVWYCHSACFRERLDVSNPDIDLSPAIF
jgi:hypothetical protein